MKEFEIINDLFKPLGKNHKSAQNFEDDAAKISLKKDQELIVSKDIMVENTHFLKKDGAFNIASKLLRVNLSDLAASGAKPLHYLLGFCKNKNVNKKFTEDFANGLKSAQDKFNINLIGGDTVNSKELVFSITIFGIIKKNQQLLRNKAKNGDLIFISQNIGDAYLGRIIKDKELQKEYLHPTPQIALGQELVKKELSKCAIDISDGLLSDLNHICQSSKLNADIFLEKIPFSNKAKKLCKERKINLLDLLSGGEDYQLIFSVNPKNRENIQKLAKKLKIKLTEIGFFKKAKEKTFKINLFDKNKKLKIKKFGYEH